MRPDPTDPQLPQRAPNLRRRHLHGIFLHSGLIPFVLLRGLKQACLIGVKRQRPAELLHIPPQQFHVLGSGIVPQKTREQSPGGIVDHRDQAHLLTTPFQPVVFAGVPLHPSPNPAPPRPPDMHLPDLLFFSSPQLAASHPCPHWLFSALAPVLL